MVCGQILAAYIGLRAIIIANFAKERSARRQPIVGRRKFVHIGLRAASFFSTTMCNKKQCVKRYEFQEKLQFPVERNA